ncbi:Ig-like domain-containing protein [uncultured Algibacter sp.]|uniref:Ig-like domain-containing protein n=1 Tax=uncultured Algibacter sp. TaxID=298659 RepID=UPI0032179A5E
MTKINPIPSARMMLLTILMTAISFLGYSQTVNVNGQTPFRKWDKIAVSLTLPSNISESNTSFRNNRMDVIFTAPNGSTIRVPGFFAADGNAANSNAKQGRIFKAYLRPYQTGSWTYRVLYYTGNNVALRNVNQLPAPIHNITGAIGNISNTNKSAPDLRAKGRLEYQKTGNNNQRRYLKWAETGEYFLKFGPDSPENLLDYNDFDHDENKKNCGLCTEHAFNPHARDWKSGDPTWDGGKGKNLIGAVNYLKNQQMNSMSMSLFGGDDKNVFPWTTIGNKFQFDVSKLEQWEIVFDHAEKNGLMLHFKLAEAENWDALTLDQIKVYYREMVARFGHHLAVEWNISEEFGGKNSTAPANAIPRIDFLASIDPWQSHRVFHTYPGQHEKFYNYLINNKAKITGASIQSSQARSYDDAYDGKSGIKTWVNKSKNNNIPWVVASDEQNSGKTGVFTSESINNNNVITQARTKILWKGLMGGGAGVMWYGGSQGDFKTENFNRFNTLFNWSKIAILEFFEGNNIEYWKMQNNDALASGNKNRCLAQVGTAYIIYLENGGTSNINLNGQSGNFSVKWFNPRNGGGLQNGSVTSISGGGNKGIGNPPNNANSDWVAFIRKGGGGTNNVAVTGINITPASRTIQAGNTFTLSRTVTPTNASNKAVSWSTSNANIATVNANGLVTAIAAGQATITSTTQNGNFTDTSIITVTGSTGGGNTTEAIAFTNLPASFGNQVTTFPIQVTYSANQQRDINVTIKSPTNQFIKARTITVSAGTNQTATVNVTVNNPLANGNRYRFVLALRPVGGKFSSNIEKQVAFANIINATSRKVGEPKSATNTLPSSVAVYPNPLNNQNLTIQLIDITASASYDIFDINGRSIVSGISNSDTIIIPSGTLKARGIYILKITANGKSFINKIIN